MRTVYVNGRIFTGEAGTPLLDSFAVRGGVFELPARPGPGDEVVDLQGAFVCPAFLDAHTHPSWVARTLGQTACLPPAVRSIEEMIAALRRQAETTPPDSWIEGWGYDESLLAEGRSPTAADLDRVSTDRPVFLTRSDGHTGCVNSVLLRRAGIDGRTPDPAGGAIGRDTRGLPDGRMIEMGAISLIRRLRPEMTEEQETEMLLRLGDHYCRHGILTVTDMMADRTARRDPLAVWRRAAQAGLPLDIALYVIWTGGTDDRGMPDLAQDEKTGQVRIAGCKIFADGSVSGATAAMRSPYRTPCADGSPNTGFLTITPDEIRAAARWALRNGVQLSVHVMGEKSLDLVLEVLSEFEDWMGDVPSVRLEHAPFFDARHEELLARCRVRLGLATQPIFPFAEWRSYRASLTEEQLAAAYPLRRMMEIFPALALSSDAPNTTWADPDDVFVSIAAAVTRRDAGGGLFGPDQALRTDEALSLYTSRAAQLWRQSAPVGRIAPGCRADFVRLSGNPLEVPSEEISRLRVQEIWRAGRSLARYG